MRTCDTCGFQNAQVGLPCSLCGAGDPALDPEGAMETPTIDLKPQGLVVRGEEIGDAADCAPGTLYAGRYRVEDLLGRGGMGSVFSVWDTTADRRAALKILHPSVARDADGRDRFHREIEIMSRIHHPSVPAILGYGAEKSDLYFVSEFVEGEDLRAVMRRRGRFPVDEAVSLAATVADALAEAHALGIVHRDVKPNNVMVGADGSIRLLDFGVARGIGLDLKRITLTGMIVGTPEYMAPEQFDSARADERCDLYALGVVLFELLTGQLPFPGDSPVTIAMKHRNAVPPAPRTLRPEVPSWLDRAILRCLEKDPARRHGTARELSAELRKDRATSGPARHALGSGDAVVTDDSDGSEHPLVLEAPREKSGWSLRMALVYEGRHFKLEGIDAPARRGAPWRYRFAYWPDGEVLRKVVDYDTDAADRRAEADRSLGAVMKRWISGKRDDA